MSELISRRQVIGGAGLAGAALLVPTAALAAPARLRVGLLTATELHVPAGQLRRGLRRGLRDLAVTYDEAAVPGGYAGAYAAVRGLLDRGADVVVAQVATPAATYLAQACDQAGAALVLANAGAHAVTQALPATVQVSLQATAAAQAQGRWAARRGRRLFQIVALPDAGYDTVYAQRRGFAAGGTFVGHAVTHAGPGTAQGVAAAVRAARASRADVIGVAATGARAATILRALRRAGLRAQVLADPLALEPWSPAHAVAHGGLVSVASTRQAPYRWLGRQVAALIEEGEARRHGRSWDRLPQILAGRRVGELHVDRHLRVATGPLLVRTTVRRAGGLHHRVLGTHPAPPALPPALAGLGSGECGSYLNEYLTT